MAIIDEIILNEAAKFDIDPERKRIFNKCQAIINKAIQSGDRRIYAKVVNDPSKYKSFLDGSSNTLKLYVNNTNKFGIPKKLNPVAKTMIRVGNIGGNVTMHIVTIKEAMKRIENNIENIVREIKNSTDSLSFKSIKTKRYSTSGYGIVSIEFKDI